MPRDFVSATVSGSQTACREYLTPVDPERRLPPNKDDLPDHVTLKNVAVQKTLPEFKP